MRWWSLPTKCWKLSETTAVRSKRCWYSVLYSSSNILPLQTHTVFWRSSLQPTVVIKQTIAVHLEFQLCLGWQLQFPSLASMKSVSDSREETRHLILTCGRPLLSPSSHAFHVSLNWICYCQHTGKARSGDVNRSPSSRLRVIKELLLGGNLEQRLELVEAASNLRSIYLVEGGQGALAVCPSHQISQTPRSNSSKTVQSKHHDSERGKRH